MVGAAETDFSALRQLNEDRNSAVPIKTASGKSKLSSERR